MKMYRILLWVEVPAIDRGDAQKKAKELKVTKGKGKEKEDLKPTLHSVEEA